LPGQKSETRSTKLETSTKFKLQNNKRRALHLTIPEISGPEGCRCFGFVISGFGFRASDFEFWQKGTPDKMASG
jgi:hypothetical protein